MREQDGAEGRRTLDKNANQTEGSRSPVGNQVGVKNLAVGTRTDLNDNDQGTKNGTTKQIYGAGIFTKETTATAKKAKLPSGGSDKGILWPENDGKEI